MSLGTSLCKDIRAGCTKQDNKSLLSSFQANFVIKWHELVYNHKCFFLSFNLCSCIYELKISATNNVALCFSGFAYLLFFLTRVWSEHANEYLHILQRRRQYFYRYIFKSYSDNLMASEIKLNAFVF